MRKHLLLLCLLLLQTAYVTQTRVLQGQLVTFSNNVGFINSTGEGVTQQMLKNFISVINTASGLFKDDVEANARYIKQKLDNSSGISNEYFYIFIQTNPPIKISYSIWMSVKRVYAGLNKVNTLNPDWSYFILRTYAPQDISEFFYLKNGILGPAISSGVKLAIMDMIETFEIDNQCTCDKDVLSKIRKSLESYFNSFQFNVVCDSNGLTSVLFYGINGMWGTFKGKCFYSIYMNL